MYTTNETFNTINILGSVIKRIEILFKETETTTVEAVGDLSEYNVNTSDSALNIRSINVPTKERNIILGKHGEPKLESLVITLPQEFKGRLLCESINSNILINDIENHFSRIHAEGLRNNVIITNGSTSVHLESLKSKLNLTNVSGSMELEGLDSSITLTDIQDDTSVTMSGLNNTFSASQLDLNYHVEMDGLSSRVTYNGNTKRTTFGDLVYDSPYIADRPTVKIESDGLKSKVIIEA